MHRLDARVRKHHPLLRQQLRRCFSEGVDVDLTIDQPHRFTIEIRLRDRTTDSLDAAKRLAELTRFRELFQIQSQQ